MTDGATDQGLLTRSVLGTIGDLFIVLQSLKSHSRSLEFLTEKTSLGRVHNINLESQHET